MKTAVVNLQGKRVRDIDLDERVFGIEPNQAVVHQAVVAQQANARQGTHDTRTRAEVAGGGKKPYRQKGTGHARQGSTRAPHYRGGGVVFGPHPRSYEKALPKKMRRLAMRSVLSARMAEQAILVIDELTGLEPKTRALLSVLRTLGAEAGAVVVLGQRSPEIWRAARNTSLVHVVTPNGLCLLDVLKMPRLVLTPSAVEELTRVLAPKPSGADAAPSPEVPSAPPAEPTSSQAGEAQRSAVPKPARRRTKVPPSATVSDAVVKKAPRPKKEAS